MIVLVSVLFSGEPLFMQVEAIVSLISLATWAQMVSFCST